MNTSNSQNDTTYICPECGGDKCTPVLKDKYRCLYCGATFYVYNPGDLPEQDDVDDDEERDEEDDWYQEYKEQKKAEEEKMAEIAAWLRAQTDYLALKKKYILTAFLSVGTALLAVAVAFLLIVYIIGLLDLDIDKWSGWLSTLFLIGLLYCLWIVLKYSYVISFQFITSVYGNMFIDKHEGELLSSFSKKDLETFRENYMVEQLAPKSDKDDTENKENPTD